MFLISVCKTNILIFHIMQELFDKHIVNRFAFSIVDYPIHKYLICKLASMVGVKVILNNDLNKK